MWKFLVGNVRDVRVISLLFKKLRSLNVSLNILKFSRLTILVPQFLVFYIRNMNKTKTGLKFDETYTENGEEFDLYAVVEHIGKTRKDGHYVSYIKSATGIWHCFDDDLVTMTNFERVKKCRVYMWVYCKKIKPTENTDSEAEQKDSI
jgi:ubiquitin C-terminal hydrolase